MSYCEHEHICGRTALPGQKRCILHSQDADKDPERFREALDEHLEENGFTFEEMLIPVPLKYYDCSLEGLNLSEAVFLKDVKFLSCTFDGEVNGLRATFKDGCAFNASKLTRGAIFREARFGSYLDFNGAEVHQSSDFSYSSIGGEAIFTLCTLEKANFGLRDFNGEARFRGATFRNGAPHFTGTTFKDRADFGSATFESPAVFESQFAGETYFNGAVFEEGGTFSDSVFSDRADFHHSNFEGYAHFRDTKFHERATFVGVAFGGYTDFSGIQAGEIDFSEIDIGGDLYLDNSLGSSGDTPLHCASFDDARVRGSLTVKGNEEGYSLEGGSVSFRNVVQASGASIKFHRADLSRCQFLGTDLREVDFLGVRWCRQVTDGGWFEGEWFRRAGLYDEVAQSNDSDEHSWAEVEQLYRQLKLNYENRGDYPRAGDFHIGEKEARLQSESRWGPWLLLYLYRSLSKYGERPLPAALWLFLVLIPGFALAYYGTEASLAVPARPVSYPDALILSLEATFYPVQSVDFQDFWPQLLSLVQRVVSPIIIALLALALRQRVKR